MIENKLMIGTKDRNVANNFKKGHPLRVLFIRTTKKNDENYIPPLGPVYLAAVIREKYPDAAIKIIDYAVDDYTFHSLAQMTANSFCPDIIGFSGMTHEFPTFYNLVTTIRKVYPKALYIAGGPISTFNYKEIFENCPVDFAVRNEGELTIIQLIESFYSGMDPHNINGIVYMKEGELKVNPQQQFIEDLDTLPLPAWDLVDFKKYSSMPNWNGMLKEKIYAPVFTSRGCPFKCTYCHSMFGKTFRFRSPEHVLKELFLLHDKYGVREIHIVDDVFNLRRERAKEICKGIINSGKRFAIAFPGGLRADIMTEEIIKLLRSAGTYKINYAIETVTPRIQKEIRKNLSMDKVQRVIDFTSKTGIITFGFFMLGFPSETKKEIQNTIDFAVNSRLDTAKFFKVTPYEGTELGDDAITKNPGLREVDLKHFTFYDTQSSVCKEVSAEELLQFLKTAYRRFYMNPARVWRILRKYPNISHAVKNLLAIYKNTKE